MMSEEQMQRKILIQVGRELLYANKRAENFPANYMQTHKKLHYDSHSMEHGESFLVLILIRMYRKWPKPT